MKTSYLIAWLIWLAGFGIIEYLAVRDKARGDTFSELMWNIVSFHPIFWCLFAGLLAWLVVHILSKGRFA